MDDPTILLVEDEAAIRRALREFLGSRGFSILEADTIQGAEKIFVEHLPDCVLLDYRLPDGTALELIPVLKKGEPAIPIIVLTAHGSIDLAVNSVKLGADNFLTKPADLSTLQLLIQRQIEERRLRRKALAKNLCSRGSILDPFIGSSSAIRQLASLTRKIATSDAPVLIKGETGAGKGVFANWLHQNSGRAEYPFVDLNCAGLSKDLLESELFGFEKGAFTGAVTPKEGLLEVAHNGTIFLDEIGDMDLQLQPKLLKVLEEKKIRRLGDVKTRHINIRLVAATNQDLQRLTAQKQFRSDLYFRINTVTLEIPPLRDRKEDIQELANFFLQQFSAEMRKPGLRLHVSALKALESYSWPGNIRELRNVLERASLLSNSEEITAGDLHFEAVSGPEPPNQLQGTKTLAEVERLHIEQVLKMCDGKVRLAAERLGIPRSSLYQKLKQLNLSADNMDEGDSYPSPESRLPV